MALKKEYTESHRICTVTFTLSVKVAGRAEKVHLVGDFNHWSPDNTPMKKTRNGSFSASVNLVANKNYQFRYLLDGKRWINEPEADKLIPTAFEDTENSVVVV